MTTESLAQRTSLDPSLITLLERISKHAKVRKIQLSPYSQDALDTFLGLPPEKQLGIMGGLQSYESIVSSLPADAGDRELVVRALGRFGMRLRDSDFFSKVEKNDVIEIYDPQGLLLYRNFTAYRYTSYSLLDLLVHEWFKLYERDTTLIEAMSNQMNDCYLRGTGTEAFRAPAHPIRERHSDHRKAFTGRMKFISPLQDTKSEKNVAVIITAEIHEVIEGEAAERLAWLKGKP